ncbi:MAG: HD domain-containing phosphohydrolase [Candidatus Omnitrophota bacterium]
MQKKDRRKQVLEALLKVSRKVSASLELERVSRMILKEVKTLLRVDYSALFLLSGDSKHLMLIDATGFKSNQVDNLKILGSWEKINTEVVRKAKAIIVNDTKKSGKFKDALLPFSSEKVVFGAFLAVPLKTESGIIGVLLVSNNKRKKARFTADDSKLLYTLANHVSIALLNAKLYKNMKDLFFNAITSLVTAVDAKDPYTHGHSERVSKYAVAIAEELNLPKESLEDLKLAGLLHDIGKIGISDSILSKKSKLDNKEYAEICKHPSIGLRIVNSVIDSKGVLGGIVEHHERFNGKGYPDHLSGSKITLEGRVVAVSDVFDTLTTDRPYQKAFSAKEALFEISRSSKTDFDPEIVKAFERSFSRYPDFWHFK